MRVVAIVFLILQSAHTQNTATERINAMPTESINARKAGYYDLSGNEVDTSPSSDGQNKKSYPH